MTPRYTENQQKVSRGIPVKSVSVPTSIVYTLAMLYKSEKHRIFSRF